MHVSVADAFENAIQVGIGQYTINYNEPLYRTNVKPTGLFFGWIGEINEYIAIDGRFGITDSKTDATGLKLSAGGLSVMARPTLPVGESFRVYGLVGASSIVVTRSAPALAETSAAKVGFSYGAGLDYRIGEHLFVGAEWVKYIQDVNYAAAGVGPINISLTGASANLKYQF
jgi:opacity protein-like surface antigen